MATAPDRSGQESAIPASELAAMEQRIRVGQFCALHDQGRISNLASPVIAAVVALVLWDDVSNVAISVWLAGVFSACILRGIVYQKFSRTASERTKISTSTRWAFLISTFISGLAWGGGMPFLFPEDNFSLQAFLIVVVLGMGAGATASFSPYFPALAVYAVPLTLPISTILLTQQTLMQAALGSFGYVFLVVLLLLGSAAHRNFATGFRLEFENAYLALGLEHAQRRLEDAVDGMSEAFALFDSDHRLILANERLRELVPDLKHNAGTGVSYAEFFRKFAATGLAGVALDDVEGWLEKTVFDRPRPLEPLEVKLADGHWLRISEEPTSDGGLVAIFSDLTQLKNREAAIEESEQRFRDFTEAASDWAWELDSDLRFTGLSGRYIDVSGRSPDFLIGKTMREVPSLVPDADWAALLDALDHRQPFHSLRLIRPDANGEPFQFLCSGVPVFGDDGTFKGYRGTGSDITAIVRAEARAREAQEQLFDAIESIAAGFILFDRDDRLVLWNSKASQFLSSDPTLIRSGTTFADLVRSSVASGNVIEANEDEGAYIAKRLRWYQNPATPLEARFVDGRHIQLLGRRTTGGGFVAIVTDMTAERTAAAALEESENRYRQLVENSPDFISIHQDGRFVFVNPAGARMLAVASPAELIGRRVLEFVHPDHHTALRMSQPTVQPGTANDSTLEFRAVRADGTEFEAEGISLEFNHGGRPAILGIVRDITVRKLAEAQLVQTSKLATLGELAAGITHELNQPLNVIRMAADSSLILMESGKTDREFERKQFARISDNAVRMAGIIGHMGAFSRREDDDGGQELIDPLESVVAAVSMVRDQYALRNVRIDIDIDERSALVYGNPVRLEQVILNLLANAHDALVLEKVDPETGQVFDSSRSGNIWVSAGIKTSDTTDPGKVARSIVIAIEDNAGGIPDDALDHIFDPFFTTKRTGQGTGLGLTIGYNIVQSMGGRISVSNGPEGARLEVWLPIAEQTGDAETTVPRASSSATDS